jgi:hypothetical protein
LLPEERPVVATQVNSAANSADGSASVMEMVKMFTAQAVAQEIVRIREFIDAELQTAIHKAFDRLSDRIQAAPVQRHATVENAATSETLNEASEQFGEESELPATPSTRHAPGEVRLTAKERRAAKRAQKMQKTKP